VAKNELPSGVGQIEKRRDSQAAVEWVREAIETPRQGGVTPAAADD
jgi:hypothetical protein